MRTGSISGRKAVNGDNWRKVAPGVYQIDAKREEHTPGARVGGVMSGVVTVVDVKWHGSNVLTLTFREDSGRVDQRQHYRDHEPSLRN
jgi:hypothetical protein